MHFRPLEVITTIPRSETIKSVSRRHTLALFAGVSLLFGLITWFYMGRALTSCNTAMLTGIPSDATGGLTWLTWVDRHAGPLPGFSRVTNAPFGESLSIPYQITGAIPFSATWLLAKFVSPFCAYNLFVFSGYMSSALVMFAFMRWLTRNTWVGLFAGFAITYTPYHQMKALFHPDYMFNFVFVIFIWAFIVFWRKPAMLPVVVMALTTAACAYIDGYFILLGGLLAGSAIIGAILTDFVLLKHPMSHLLERLKGLACYAGMSICLLLPVISVTYMYSDTIARSLGNARGNRDILFQASVYSARPYEYLVPAVNHPLLPDSYRSMLDSGLHQSSYIENTLYVGIVVLAFAGVAWVRFWRHPDKRAEEARNIPLGFLISVATFVLVAALAFSFPPTMQIFDFNLPMPSWLIVHATSVWRAFARLFLVLETCLVVIAGLGLWFVIRRRRLLTQALISIVVVTLVFIDFLTQSRAVVWSSTQAPDVYRWLKTQRDVKTVVEYPLGSAGPTAYYITYQMIDGKARVNSARTDESQGQLQGSILGLADPQTLPVLRALGVDLVLSHDEVAVKGLEIVRHDYAHHYNDAIRTFIDDKVASSATQDEVWTYRIKSSETAAYAVVVGNGFQSPFFDKRNHTQFPLGAHGGQLSLMQMPGANKRASVHVSLTVEAENIPGVLSFVQHGRVLWQGSTERSGRVQFNSDPESPIDVVPVPRSDPGIILLSNIKAQA